MGSSRLESDQNKIWSANLLDFNANVANNFCSCGFPNGYDALTRGGGGTAATVVLQAINFFSRAVDADRGFYFHNIGSNFRNPRLRGRVGFAFASHSLCITGDTMLHVGPASDSASNFSYYVAAGHYDFASSNVNSFFNGALAAIYGVANAIWYLSAGYIRLSKCPTSGTCNFGKLS